MKTLLAASAAAVLAGGAAYAQDAAPSAAPAPQAQPAADFSEADVRKFANLLVAFEQISAEHAASGAATPAGEDPEAKARMAAAVEGSGLSFEAYNDMATRLNSDDDFNRRVASHMPD